MVQSEKKLKMEYNWSNVVGATAYDLLVDQDIDIETFCVCPNAAEAMSILANEKVLFQGI